MPSPDGKDNGLGPIRDKLKAREEDHDVLIEIRTTVKSVVEKLDCIEKKVVFKDTCAANHNTDQQRMERVEGDIKELKDGNNNRITFGIAILAVIVAVIIPIATAFIH